ncbi:MAG TPA: Spy/CpxP family protein refolding chaperone [Usitatibacter sp.]|nr:Spy/CpxP family protein refolding chaperone [Usitatibacter sp.]
MKIAATLIAACVALAFAASACAQGYGRHGGGSRDSPSSRERDADKDKPAHATPEDPFSSLARELPSLRIDLGLTTPQVEAWNPFERDVRDLAEMATARRRHLMALRESGENPPSALTVVSSIVEDDRLRAEASRDLKSHLAALYESLTDGQKRMFDKRVVQSQTEPLGK